MSKEFKLSFSGQEIDNRLKKISNLIEKTELNTHNLSEESHPNLKEYINNSRLGWTDIELIEILPMSTIKTNEMFNTKIDLMVGRKYRVIYNGVEFNCEGKNGDPNYPSFYLGTGAPLTGNCPATDEPFCIVDYDTSAGTFIFDENNNEVTVSISEIKETVHQIDSKYIPSDKATNYKTILSFPEISPGSMQIMGLTTPLIKDKKYIIEYNNKIYPTVCKEISLEGMPLLFIANQDVTSLDVLSNPPADFFGIGSLSVGEYGTQNIVLSTITAENFAIHLIVEDNISPLLKYKDPKIIDTVSFMGTEDNAYFGSNMILSIESIPNIINGFQYEVIIDGVSHISQSRIALFEGEFLLSYIGNGQLIGGYFGIDPELCEYCGLVNTGEDFAYINAMEMEDTVVSIFGSLKSFTSAVIKEKDVDVEFNYSKFNGSIGYTEQKGSKYFIKIDDPASLPQVGEYGDVKPLFKYSDEIFNPYDASFLTVKYVFSEALLDLPFTIYDKTSKNGVSYKAIKIKASDDTELDLILIVTDPIIFANWVSAGVYSDLVLDKGVYVIDHDGLQVYKLGTENYINHPIDVKYLPKGIGYDITEPNTIYRFDGNVFDKEGIETDVSKLYYIKISDEPIDFNTITGLKTENIINQIITYSPDTFVTNTKADKNGIQYKELQANYYYAWVLSLTEPTTFRGRTISVNNWENYSDIILTPGTYALVDNNNGYLLHEIHCGNNITTIPIPNDYTPNMIIDLQSMNLSLDSLFANTAITMPKDKCAEFQKMARLGKSIYINYYDGVEYPLIRMDPSCFLHSSAVFFYGQNMTIVDDAVYFETYHLTIMDDSIIGQKKLVKINGALPVE